MEGNNTHDLEYNEEFVSNLLSSLIDRSGDGDACFYEIKVDTLIAVSKTIDLDRFLKFQDYIMAESELVQINLFKGDSYHKTTYNLYLQGLPERIEDLGQIAQHQTIQKLTKSVRKWKQKARKLKRQVAYMRENRWQLGGADIIDLGGKILSNAGNRMLQQNGGLSGLMNKSERAIEREEPQQDNTELNEWQQVKAVFTQAGCFEELDRILAMLAARPDLVPEIKSIIHHKINNNEQSQSSHSNQGEV